MSGEQDATVPQWAADLRVSVAKIEGRTEQIPDLVRRLEELRATTVPLSEHAQLMQQVETLWQRDLTARTQWEEVTTQVPQLWDERSQRQAVQRMYRVWLSALSVLVTLLSGFVVLRDLGLSVNFGHR